ncbi:MAG TPA: nuclease-related domain-containing protein [Sporichthyaceae bacterium]|nr:nuclease-related domain-containing protein [Sporichthyaceae bacterium]
MTDFDDVAVATIPAQVQRVQPHKPAVLVPQQATRRGLFARVRHAHAEERAWRADLLGEQYVAKRLAGLGPAWRVVHALTVGERGEHIDHLVIGPTGVFTLHIERRTGGHHLHHARVTARRAAHLLTNAAGHPVEVTPVLVFVGLEVEVREWPTDVLICDAGDLPRLLKNRAPVLSPVTVGSLHALARRPGTWR